MNQLEVAWQQYWDKLTPQQQGTMKAMALKKSWVILLLGAVVVAGASHYVTKKYL